MPVHTKYIDICYNASLAVRKLTSFRYLSFCHVYFEEKAFLEVRDHIYDLMAKQEISFAELEARMGMGSLFDLAEMLEDGTGLTVKRLSIILYFLGYKMLFTTAPLGSKDHLQAEHWRRR